MLCLIYLKSRDPLCAQLRSGILALTVETGQFVSLEEEKQICSTCCLTDVENKFHFVF